MFWISLHVETKSTLCDIFAITFSKEETNSNTSSREASESMRFIIENLMKGWTFYLFKNTKLFKERSKLDLFRRFGSPTQIMELMRFLLNTFPRIKTFFDTLMEAINLVGMYSENVEKCSLSKLMAQYHFCSHLAFRWKKKKMIHKPIKLADPIGFWMKAWWNEQSLILRKSKSSYEPKNISSNQNEHCLIHFRQM